MLTGQHCVEFAKHIVVIIIVPGFDVDAILGMKHKIRCNIIHYYGFMQGSPQQRDVLNGGTLHVGQVIPV